MFQFDIIFYVFIYLQTQNIGTSKYPDKVRIVEVGPRDGLQNESTIVSTQVKIDFINMLTKTGLQNIEVTRYINLNFILFSVNVSVCHHICWKPVKCIKF